MFACAVKHPDVEISHRDSNWAKKACVFFTFFVIHSCLRESEIE